MGIQNIFLAAANSKQSDDFALGVLTSSFLFFGLLLVLGFYVMTSIFLMQLFKKTGIKEGWKAWIPIVNSWTFLQLGGYPGWIILLVFLSIVPIFGWIASLVVLVFLIMAAYQISLKFGKDGLWTVLYFFLQIVWTGILGLGSATWDNARGTRSTLIEEAMNDKTPASDSNQPEILTNTPE